MSTPPAPLADAPRYIEHGFCVMPLNYPTEVGDTPTCSCPDGASCGSVGKHPNGLLVPQGLHDATKDLAMVAEWRRRYPRANIGAGTGAASGIIVIETDPRHGGDATLRDLEAQHGALPRTPVAISGGGGNHYHLKHPGFRVKTDAGALGEGVDVRGDDGLIVLPPSLHRSGALYEWDGDRHIDDTPIAELPEAWKELLRSLSAKEEHVPLDTAAALAGVPEGQREVTVWRLACKLRGVGLPLEMALKLVLDAAANCTPPYPVKEAQERVRRAYQKYEPEPEFTLVQNGRIIAGAGSGGNAAIQSPVPQQLPAPADGIDTVALLPAFAQLTEEMTKEAAAVRAIWLDPWIAAARTLSPRTPASLLEASGLFALNLAIARRVYVRTGPKFVYPVLLLLFVGRSTLTGKTTALAALRLLVRDTALLDLLLPSSFTPQALTADLALHVPQPVRDGEGDEQRWLEKHRHAAQRAIIRDEAAGIFEDCAKDYNSGLLPLILKLADAPDDLDSDMTVSRGLIEVRNVAVNLMGATTPEALREHAAKAHHWANGLFGRLALIGPDEPPRYAFWDDAASGIAGPVVQQLRRLYEALPRPAAQFIYRDTDKGQRIVGAEQVGYGALQATLRRDAWDAYHRYDRALYSLSASPDASERLDPTYGRLPQMAVKIALALATMEWSGQANGTPIIDIGHWSAAQQITERWRASAHTILAAALRSEAEEQAETAVNRLMEALRKAGGTANRGDVQRTLNWTKAQLDSAIRDAGERVKEISIQTGGRPSARLELVEKPLPAVTTKGTKAPARGDAADFSSNVTTKVPDPPGGNGFSAFSSNGQIPTNGALHPRIERWGPDGDGWEAIPDDTAEVRYEVADGLEIRLPVDGQPRQARRIPPVPADAPRCRLCGSPLPCPHGHPNPQAAVAPSRVREPA